MFDFLKSSVVMILKMGSNQIEQIPNKAQNEAKYYLIQKMLYVNFITLISESRDRLAQKGQVWFKRLQNTYNDTETLYCKSSFF